MSDKIKITAQNLSSLSALYGVSRNSMREWLRKANLLHTKEQGYLYTPKEVKAIFEHLGYP